MTFQELLQYAYAERNFSDYLSVEFGQSLALVISILFIVFFSTLFLSDVKSGLSDILYINMVSPEKMIDSKYLSAFAMVVGCICMDIISVNIMQFLYLENISRKEIFVVWGNALLYVIPTILFLSSLSSFLCVFFQNAVFGVALLLFANFISSFPVVLSNGSRRQSVLAPFLFSFHSFFESVSREEFTAILWNRLVFCLIGLAVLKLTVLAWKRPRREKRVRKSPKWEWFDVPLHLPRSFFFYNVKIIFTREKLAALSVVFFLPFLSIQANSDLLDVSRSILLMTGWASVILFSNLKSIEYADNTIELYRLSEKKGMAVGIRFLIGVATIVLFMAAAFFLSLFKIRPFIRNMEYIMETFSRMLLSCVSCCCLLGSITMSAGFLLKKTWTGLAVGLIVNILLSQNRTASIFDLYLFYYFPGKENIWLWFGSLLFYTMISFGILFCNMWDT